MGTDINIFSLMVKLKKKYTYITIYKSSPCNLNKIK